RTTTPQAASSRPNTPPLHASARARGPCDAVASGTLATDPPDGLGTDLSRARRRGRQIALLPWTLALAVTAPLATAYLVLEPTSGDLAAATYRSDLFARFGFAPWDNGW